MALYLGSSAELRICSNNLVYALRIPTVPSVTECVSLLSFDNYILADLNGVYLLPKDAASFGDEVTILSSSSNYNLI